MDEVPVLVADLRMIGRALSSAYGAQVAADLAQQYRNMDEAHRPSNLAKALDTAHKRVEGYIAEGEAPEEDEDPTSVETPDDVGPGD